MLVQGFVNSFPAKYLFMWDFFFRLAFGPAKTSWAVKKPLKSPLDPRSLCFSNLQDLDPKPTKFWWAYAGLAGSPTSSLLMCYWSPSSSECLIAFRKRETHLPAKGAAHTETSALLAGCGEQKPSLPPLCTRLRGEATSVSQVKQVSSFISWNSPVVWSFYENNWNHTCTK